MSNVYHDELKKTYWDNQMNAERLLNVMRGMIEPVLQKYEKGRHCKSQSYRAKVVAGYLREEIKYLRPLGMEATKDMSHALRTIEDFLAVHRTVWILEGRAG